MPVDGTSGRHLRPSGSFLLAPLLVVALIDELQSGLPVVASPDLQAEHRLDAAALAAALFTAPMLVGTLVEPVLLRLTERLDRRWPLAVALVGMAICQGWVAAAPSAISLSAAVAVWGIGSGLATTFAEVALIARSRDPHRAMSRWGLLGSLGDIGAPLLYAACAGMGLGWQAAVGIGAGIAAVDAAVILVGPPLREIETDDKDEEEGDAREVWRSFPVWLWLAAAAACTLLDEIFLSMGSLWLREAGISPQGQGLAFSTFAAGMALGQALTPALLKRTTPDKILLWAALACAALWPLWLASPALLVSGVGTTAPISLALGLAVAPMWSLSTANAYAAGKRPSAVAALNKLLSPLEVAAPLLLGLIADQLGLLPALLCLLLQPLAVGLAAYTARQRAEPQATGGAGSA